MTPEEQRIAIAEACGWKRETRRKWAGAYGVPGWGKNKHLRLGDRNRYFTTSPSYFPDYLNDLSAMFQAQEILKNDGERDRYMMELGKIMGASERWGTFATAVQRAEAFLKTVGRWKE